MLIAGGVVPFTEGVPAALLRELGVDVPAECVDGRGFTYPRLTTLPMGFGPSPGIAQAAHEAVLYGREGAGSEQARQLEPVVSPTARWSGQRVPDVESPEASAPHALVIDDLLVFRQVLRRSRLWTMCAWMIAPHAARRRGLRWLLC